MRFAASAGGAPESPAYVQTLPGNLELSRGRPARRAGRLPRRASNRARLPRGPRGTRARGRGARRPSHGRRAPAPLANDRLPLARWRSSQRSSSRWAVRRAARAHLRPRARSSRATAPAAALPDAEAVLFEANHGSAARAVRLGRRVWRREAEHPLRRRARLGAHARGAPARGPRLGAASAAHGLARSDVQAARGPDGAPRRAARRRRGATCGSPAGGAAALTPALAASLERAQR